MEIKNNLDILKNTPNILDLSLPIVSSFEIPDGVNSVKHILSVFRGRVSHFTKPSIYRQLDSQNPLFVVVRMPKYILPVTWNKKTSQIILNLDFFGTDDISRVSAKDLYSLLVYGYCFKILVNNEYVISRKHSTLFSQFLISMLVKMFGKDYGLLGTFSPEINKLKFLTNCYVQCSFFGISQTVSLYNTCASMSGYSPREDFDPSDFDFTSFRQYVISLNKTGCMPDFDIYKLSTKVVRQFGFSFLPIFEDISRFVSIFTTSDLFGNKLAPGYIRSFNEPTFQAIMTLSEYIFKRL